MSEALEPGILNGVRVVDFSWVAAGPLSGALLATLGASVIRVESAVRLDPARGSVPLKNGAPGFERGGYYAGLNAGKRNLCLEFGGPSSHEIIQRLLRWADISIENFAPGTAARLGLDYESQKRQNPAIIMASLSLFGQSGELSGMRGFGIVVQGMSGLGSLIGWPDGSPAGFSHAYPDYISPLYAVCALVSALDYRDRTGEGQYIDVAQLDVALNLRPVSLALYSNSGVEHTRNGNLAALASQVLFAPHGVYPCANDTWIAIAARDQVEWASLLTVFDNEPSLCADRFGTPAGRCHSVIELDKALSRATQSRLALELEAELQARGVPAAKVLTSVGLYQDTQLEARGHFVEVDHPTLGKIHVERPGFRFSQNDLVSGRSPTLGEHNEEIIKDVLGFSDGDYNRFLTDGTVGLYGLE